MWRSIKSYMEFYMDLAEAGVVKQTLLKKKKKQTVKVFNARKYGRYQDELK